MKRSTTSRTQRPSAASGSTPSRSLEWQRQSGCYAVLKRRLRKKTAMQPPPRWSRCDSSWYGRWPRGRIGDIKGVFLNARVKDGEVVLAQPPLEWQPPTMSDREKVISKLRKALHGLRTSPKRWKVHLGEILAERALLCIPTMHASTSRRSRTRWS